MCDCFVSFGDIFCVFGVIVRYIVDLKIIKFHLCVYVCAQAQLAKVDKRGMKPMSAFFSVVKKVKTDSGARATQVEDVRDDED